MELTRHEQELLNLYRQLPDRDKPDVIACILFLLIARIREKHRKKNTAQEPRRLSDHSENPEPASIER